MSAEGKDRFNPMRHRWLGMVARDDGLTVATYRVAMLLWEHMNADYGCAWPSFEYIANQLQIHGTTVIRAIKRLEARGWITVERRCGRHRGNRYRPAFGNLGPEADDVLDEGWQDCTKTVAPLH